MRSFMMEKSTEDFSVADIQNPFYFNSNRNNSDLQNVQLGINLSIYFEWRFSCVSIQIIRIFINVLFLCKLLQPIISILLNYNST